MKNVILVPLLIMLFAGCQFEKKTIPKAEDGILDLSAWDFTDKGSIELNGNWTFYPYSLVGLDSLNPPAHLAAKPMFMEVPGSWRMSLFGQSNDAIHYGIYQLTVLLPEDLPAMAIKFKEASTAYHLIINGVEVGANGTVGKTKETAAPEYSPQLYPLSGYGSALDIVIEVSNFDVYLGGLIQPLTLGTYEDLDRLDKQSTLMQGVLQGILLLGFLFFLILYLYRRKAIYHLYISLYCLGFYLHLICIDDRLLYTLLGSDGWHFAFRFEIFSFYFNTTNIFLFYISFWGRFISRNRRLLIISPFVVLGLLAFVIPFPVVSMAQKVIPISLLLALGLLFYYILIKAISQKWYGYMIIFIIFLLIGVVTLTTKLQKGNLIEDTQIREIEPLHIPIVVHLLLLILLLGRNIIKSFNREEQLALDLKEAKEIQEKQNASLEKIVEERSDRLVKAELENHRLLMEKKEQDLDMLRANNLMKMQYTENLITDLESLAVSEKDLKKGLYGIIFRLKGQFSVDERQQVLHTSIDKVNAEFYDRLGKRFPQLNKTEHELCAYIKLNLSNQEIAELRNTSLNTINVMRSRLRKKLGLSRQDELGVFIQSI